MTLRIIGCGNVDRGDDAAGVLVVRRLRALDVEPFDVETFEQSGESFSLMDSWIGYEHVILVDAIAPNGTPGVVQVWNAHTAELREDVFPCSTHAFGLREAVELARTLNRLPPRLQIYGIEGKQFSFHAPLSPEVEHAVESVAQQLLELVRTMAAPTRIAPNRA